MVKYGKSLVYVRVKKNLRISENSNVLILQQNTSRMFLTDKQHDQILTFILPIISNNNKTQMSKYSHKKK